jgi:competence protein ComEC
MRIGDNRLARLLIASFMAERDRWFLWSPLWLAAGAAFYFSRPEPLPISWLIASFAISAGIYLLARGRHAALGICLIAAVIALFCGGMLAASWRLQRAEAPVLANGMPAGMVTGRVVQYDLASKGARVVLDHVLIEGVAPAKTPHKVRLRLTRYSAPPQPGAVIMLKAVLMPPPGPDAPGAHDFRRDAYFEGIGGSGYAIGRPQLLEQGAAQDRTIWLEGVRQRIALHIASALGPTPEAAIATAYLTGERGLIDDATADDMRNSGLAHLLAISGMKVGLVAVLVFTLIRTMVALVPGLALHVSGRKAGAIGGIVAALGYTLLAAAPVPALRSVLMTGMSMGAILADRQSFSLRLAAIAALIVIIWQPDTVLGASFQMSFGAVVTLIAFYEAFRQRIAGFYRGAGRVRRFGLDLVKILLTTLVATLVTSPLALFHFQQEANYSLPANALAIPLNDFWIMPCAMLAMALMPMGLDHWPLAAMGKGIEIMLRIAHAVSAWPGAVTHTPLLPTASLVLALLGLFWLIIWRGKWRRLGLGPIVLAVGLAFLMPQPQILITDDAKRVAVRLADGSLAVNAIGKKDFTIDSWRKLSGNSDVALFPVDGSSTDQRLTCGNGVCQYQLAALPEVAILHDPASAESGCGADRIVISENRLQLNCPAKLLIDPDFLARHGATALYAQGETYRIETVAGLEGHWPWSPDPSTEH